MKAARIDCCTLANNHALDWQSRGLLETLNTLHAAGIQTTGAGSDEGEAHAPAVILMLGKGRVLIFGYGLESSGVPPDWAAESRRAGLGLLYVVTLAHDNGALVDLKMWPTQMKQLRLTRPSGSDTLWLKQVLGRESKRFGTQVKASTSGALTLSAAPTLA